MKFVLSDLWQSDRRSHQRSLCTVTPQLVMFQWKKEKKTLQMFAAQQKHTDALSVPD